MQRDASPKRKDPTSRGGKVEKLLLPNWLTVIPDDSFDTRGIHAHPLLEHTTMSEMETLQEQTRARIRYTREFMVALKDEHTTLAGGVEKLGCVSVVSCIRFRGNVGWCGLWDPAVLGCPKMPGFRDVRNPSLARSFVRSFARSLARRQPAWTDRRRPLPTPPPREFLTRASYPFTGICTSITWVP